MGQRCAPWQVVSIRALFDDDAHHPVLTVLVSLPQPPVNTEAKRPRLSPRCEYIITIETYPADGI